MRPRKISGTLTAIAGLAGCADAAPPAHVTVTDSAGIEVVTNRAGSIEAAETWTPSAGPLFEVGAGAGPEVPLHRISAVAPLESGGVAVGTESPPRVVLFRRDGSLAETLGRKGEGPGEFTRVGSVVPLGGDSVAVWDPDRRRLSVFGRDGRLVRDTDLSHIAQLSPLAAPSSAAPASFTHLLTFSPGTLVLFAVGAFGPGTGVRRVEAASYRITIAGEVLDTLGPFPGYETYVSDQTGLVPYIFGADTHAASSGDALVVGTAESPELRRYGPDGGLERIVRWPDHDRSVAGPFVEDWNDFVENEWLANRGAAEREAIRDLLDRIPLPARLPAHDRVIAAGSGDIWVAEYVGQLELPGIRRARVPARRWLVFDADGTLTARVRTPEGFEPRAVRDGVVWGVFRDEMDVESVQAYELVTR